MTRLPIMNGLRCASLAATVAILVSGAPAATASATPGVGVEAVVLSQGSHDGQDYITKEITIAPGGSTGWHWHPGRVFGVIRQGTLTHDTANCAVDGVYPAGAPITESTGPNNVHIGRNLGPDPLVMWVTYVEPAGGPLSIDAPDPGCPFE
jgi:quercetin dioxygenase-like cupin family protein